MRLKVKNNLTLSHRTQKSYRVGYLKMKDRRRLKDVPLRVVLSPLDKYYPNRPFLHYFFYVTQHVELFPTFKLSSQDYFDLPDVYNGNSFEFHSDTMLIPCIKTNDMSSS